MDKKKIVYSKYIYNVFYVLDCAGQYLSERRLIIGVYYMRRYVSYVSVILPDLEVVDGGDCI